MREGRLGNEPSGVEGADDTVPAAAQDVGVDHRRADVAMPEQFLDRADVIAALEKLSGEGMTQRLA